MNDRTPIGNLRKAPAEARILTIPVLALYVYLILDLVPPITESDRLILYLLCGVVLVLLIGTVGVRMRAEGMFYVFLIGALLQAFTTMAMFATSWRNRQAILFLNALLILSLLFIAWRFRRAARSGR